MISHTCLRLQLYAVVITLSAATSLPAQVCEPAWDSSKGPPGMNSPVNVVTIYNDGRGDALYAGGRFTTAGGIKANKIARWSGNNWSPLGSGIAGLPSAVHALTVFDDSTTQFLIAGGEFSSAGGVNVSNIAQWDGRVWSALGSGVDSRVFALTTMNDPKTMNPSLFVGGDFTTAGEIMANRIAGWDGDQWFALGDGLNGPVFALAVFDDGTGAGEALYVGGTFTLAGGIEAHRIARWDGSSWFPLNDGFGGSVFALEVFDDGFGPALFVGGQFTTAGGMVVDHIARWDGVDWFPVGTGTKATVRALTVFDDGTGAGEALYVGGTFTTAGDITVNRIAKWDGQLWSALGTGVGNVLFGLTSTQNLSSIGPALYAGGSFLSAGGLKTNYIARWTGCFDRPGDFDGDGFTDLNDYRSFHSCITGPGIDKSFGCEPADTDMDGDVDLFDAAMFQNFFLP